MKGVARLYHWKPDYLNQLYLDDADEMGLQFWFNDAEAYQKEIREASGGKKK